MSLLAREVNEHREPRRSLDEGADRRTLQPDHQIAFPVAGNGPVFDLGWSPADHHFGGDVGPGLSSWPRPGARRARPPKTRHQLTFARATALDVERPVDGLVADRHGLVIGEIDLQAFRDLFRAPSLHPAPVTSMGLVAALAPRALRAGRGPIGAVHPAAEPVLDMATKPLIRHELRSLESTGDQLCLPLGDRRSTVELPATRGRIAAQLPLVVDGDRPS